jgi:hypothetical protein
MPRDDVLPMNGFRGGIGIAVVDAEGSTGEVLSILTIVADRFEA